ncbi:MAG: tyrosine-type recombinase/integrase [Campylobacterota bacterium]|nr:tyrosine-type recombinase/integrase [Campylobacterota bacterium]
MSDISKAWMDDFLAYISDVRGYSERSVTTYEIALRQMLEQSELYEEGDRWILDISSFRLKIAKNSKKTIAKKLSTIHSFVSYLQNQREIVIRLIADESVRVPQTLPKPIDEQYILEVLTDATLQEKLLIAMLYGLGLRIGELSGLRIEDIHPEWIEVRGKGNRVRQLPLLATLHTLIEQYLDLYSPKEYLFEKGAAMMNQAQLRYILTKCFKSKGLKATPHQLRHSFATHMLNSGARISDVSELLGHSSMASTQVYTKLADSKKLKEYLEAHPLAIEG